MDERDRKILARLRREASLAAPQRRATSFRSPKDYRRKPKHGKPRGMHLPDMD